MRKLYLLGAILGIILPYYYFIQFVLENGLNVNLFIDQLFANPVSAFFGMDVIVSSLVLLCSGRAVAKGRLAFAR